MLVWYGLPRERLLQHDLRGCKTVHAYRVKTNIWPKHCKLTILANSGALHLGNTAVAGSNSFCWQCTPRCNGGRAFPSFFLTLLHSFPFHSSTLGMGQLRETFVAHSVMWVLVLYRYYIVPASSVATGSLRWTVFFFIYMLYRLMFLFSIITLFVTSFTTLINWFEVNCFICYFFYFFRFLLCWFF